MDCKYVRANTNLMKSEAAQLREIKNDLVSQFNDLYAELAAMDSMWEGPAKTSFFESIQKDKQLSDSFYKDMEEFINQLESAAAAYEKCENEVYSFLSKLNV